MIKESFLEMAERHQAGDMLVQGEWKMSSVGCFNRDYGNDPHDFAALSKSSGYPEWKHRIQETVFERLTLDDAIKWHVQFAQKMETIKDFDVFYHSFMIGVLEVALPHDKYNVVQPVIDLHKNYENATSDDWEKARAAEETARASAKVDWHWVKACKRRSANAVHYAGLHAIESAAAASFATFWADMVVDAVRAAVESWAAARFGAGSAAGAGDDAWKKIEDAFLKANGGE